MSSALPQANPSRSVGVNFAALGLLVLFWWLAMSASRHWSQTSDELPHVMAGVAYDRYGDFRLQPENGVLPQRVHGLAPLALGARLPDDPVLWQHSQVWQLGWSLFYGLDNPTDRMLLVARGLNALFGVALGAFLFVVARRWYGPAGGLFTLLLFCFSPEFLFHSAQATSDVAGTLCLTVAAWAAWAHLQQRRGRSALLAGLAAGLALVAKFSGLLLVPVCVVLVAADAVLHAAPGARWRRLAGNVAMLIPVAVLAVGVIWLFYGFRFRAQADGLPPLVDFLWPWTARAPLTGGKGTLIGHALSLHLLPEAYLRGLDYVFASETARPAFFAGEYRLNGWWQFFPTLFLAKTTLALLFAGIAALVAGVLGLRRGPAGSARALVERWLPLATPALITACAAVTSSLNIGHRHILSVYPALLVAAGSLALLPRRWLALPLALAGLQVAESQSIRPHYLAYFNPLCPPERAYRVFADSSLDWGQDLPALAEWLQANRHAGEKFYCSYFGSAWPPHYGVRPTIFLPGVSAVNPPLQPYELEPGLYCLSATSLAEVYSEFSGPWQAAWEQQLRAGAGDYDRLVRLRFSRLCKYLQARQPDAQAGYSILIYRLDATELAAALHGPVHGW